MLINHAKTGISAQAEASINADWTNGKKRKKSALMTIQ